MDKRVVIPVAVAIVVGGTVVAKKILSKPKNQDSSPATSTSGEKLTETQRALQDPAERWKRA